MKTNFTKLIILYFMMAWTSYQTNAQNPDVISNGFVYAEGEKFMLNGQPFYFSGANVYDFFTYGSSSGDIETQFMDKERIDEHMRRLYVNGVRVVRLWGFSHEDWHGFEPEKGVYSEAQFSLFDYVIKSAEANGIKLIVALENYWNDYGGIKDRLKWEGIDVAGAGEHDQGQFFTNTDAINGFKNYIEYFITRVNHYDGLAYRDDPTILAWELMNEPRYQGFGDDLSSDTLRAWVDDMGAFIKGIDPNHLLGTGLEGHGAKYNFGGDEGNDFIKIHQSPFIDFTSAHPYIRESWSNFSLEETMKLICQWADESHSIIKKPLYVGEFNVEIQERYEWWEEIYGFIEEKKIGASAFWWFPDNNTPRDKFGVFEGDVEVAIYKEHALKMEEMSGGEYIYLSLMSPKSGDKFVSGSTVHIEANLINENNTIAKVEFFSDGILVGEDTIAPYELDLTDLPDGEHKITSIATGINGIIKESTSRNIQIGGDGVLTLEYKDASTSVVSNVIKPHFRLFNNSSQDVAFDNLSIRYWYEVEEDLAQNFFVDYAVVGSNNILGKILKIEGNRYYLEITFDPATGVLGRNDGSGTIETKIANAMYSDVDQANDYSFDGTKKEFSQWEKVALYLNGELISGIEPEITNRVPNAVFTASTISGDTPLVVAFDASGSSDPDGDDLVYNWDFGDGTSGSGVNVSHLFTDIGTYDVLLTVSDGVLTDTETIEITVQDGDIPNVIANMVSDTVTGVAPITINFDATGSISSDGSALTYSWDFGDTTTGNGSRVSHEYVNEGVYTVIVTVTNATGVSDTDTETITVTISDPSGDCAFGAPLDTPLATIPNASYNNIHVLGTGGPDFSNVTNFTINWDLQNNGLWQFSMNTNNGIPNWWNDLKTKITAQSFNNAQPGVTISGTGFSNFDGSYYVAVDEDNFALVSRDNPFTIYFSNSMIEPDCGNLIREGVFIKSNRLIKIYPNPSKTEFQITIGDSEKVQVIKVYSLNGRELITLDQNSFKNNEITFGEELSTGAYLLKVIKNEGVETFKLIKE